MITTQLYIRVGQSLVPVTREQIAVARTAAGSEVGANYKILVGDENGLTVVNDILTAEQDKAIGKPCARLRSFSDPEVDHAQPAGD